MASFAVLFILILTLAGLSIAVVNAMFSSPWGAYTVFCTIPIALIMGIWMHVVRPGDVKGGSVLGVVLLAIVILTGPYVAASPTLSSMLTLSKNPVGDFYPALRIRGLGPSRVAVALSPGFTSRPTSNSVPSPPSPWG